MGIEATITASHILPDETATLALGHAMAAAIKQHGSGCVLYLRGELGTGKTTLSRGLLHGLGVLGKVKSPTYTLVEPYSIPADEPGQVQSAYHFDLYRLADPEELEFMGIRDYDTSDSILIIEWPERGEGYLPEADLDIRLDYHVVQRRIEFHAVTARGEALLDRLKHSEPLA